MRRRSQHAVPCFYLRRFTSEDGQRVLWRYAKDDDAPRPISPRRAEAELGFYSVPRPDGPPDDSFEDSLGRVERRAAEPLRQLAEGLPLCDEDRYAVSYFIALMFLRVRGYAAHAAEQARAAESPEFTLAFLEKSCAARFFSREVIERYREEVRHRGRGLELPSNYQLAAIPGRAVGYASLLNRMRWTVCHARADFFVTSDNPAYARRPQSLEDPGLLGMARKDFGVELGFPLARRAYLIGHWGPLREGRCRVTADRVRELNRRTVVCASRYVYSAERSDTIAALVARHKTFQLSYPRLQP